jgi:hypothetical protein
VEWVAAATVVEAQSLEIAEQLLAVAVAMVVSQESAVREAAVSSKEMMVLS